MITKLLILQVIAHLLADFWFQPQKWCEAKKKLFYSKELYFHSFIVLICSFIFSFSLLFWWYALVVAVLHLLIDVTKSWIVQTNYFKKEETEVNILEKYLFFIDQFVHFIVIIMVVFLFAKNNSDISLNNCFTKRLFDLLSLIFSEKIILFLISTKGLFVIFSLIFCTKPANILIKKVMDICEIKISNIKDDRENKKDADESLMNAGRIIGTLERILSFGLILFGQYEAVGFIIAAKSILRFRDTENAEAKTEYLLIGSLLSFGIAILLGIYCNYF